MNSSPGTQANYKLMDVFLGYLGKSPCNPNYLSCREHLTQANADALLHDVMGYNHDFPQLPACNQVAQSCP